MAYIALTLRKRELKNSVADRQMTDLKYSREMRKLTQLSDSLADGYVTPSEIASCGMQLFGTAIDFMYFSSEAADFVAQEQTAAYVDTYAGLTQEQYYNNPGIATQAKLYFDETGTLDEDAMYSEFYEEALKEYVNEEIMPLLNEKEKELQAQKDRNEIAMQEEQAELDQLDGAISDQISKSAINLH